MKIKVKYNRDYERAFKLAQRESPKATRRGMVKATDFAHRYVRMNKLRGGNPLYSRSGTLTESLRKEVRQKGDQIYGIVGTDIRWARVHELGAVIYPVHGEYLRYPLYERGTGNFLGWRSSKSVRIPRRAWLKPTAQDIQRRVTKILLRTFNLELKREVLRHYKVSWGTYSGA